MKLALILDQLNSIKTSKDSSFAMMREAAVAQPLTLRDREIAEALGPALYDEGLMLVGLDVIGDYLTE
jgi:glutathione synthase/RimK-type ligase-like ATP-grasp enzyme